MVRSIYTSILLVVLCVMSCSKQQSNGTEKQEKTKEQASNKITEQEIDALRFADYALSDASLIKLDSWIQYQELSTNIEQLRLGTFAFFADDKAIVEEFLNELKVTLPENLNTNAIQARIIALETAIYRLHGELVASKNSKENILQAIKETLISFANLNFQINKKFEKESQNIQKPR